MNRGTLLVVILLSAGCICLEQKNALTDEEIDILRQSGITVTIHSNHTLTIEHHGYPNHTFEGGWGDNPNTPSAQNYSVLVPRNATVATEKGCVYMGPIGLSLSGASFYNPYTGQGNNAVEGSCAETFDNCSGHPSPDGAYHYHKIPSCIYRGDNLRNKLLGVAYDGYPIYGPMDHTGKNWTSLELDQCHGHVDAHLGRYVYRATHDFPYILGCYHGETLINNMQTMLPPPGGMMPPGNGTGGMMPPGNGTRPPPPPGRRKRHDSASMNAVHSGEFVRFDKERNQVRYRRQMFPSNNPCLNVANPNWQQNTCYAWCNIPSSGNFDNCPYGPIDINVNSSSPVPIADFKDPVNAGHLLICNALYTMVAITMYFIQ